MLRLLLVLILVLTSLTASTADATGKIRVAILPFSTPAGIQEMQQYGEGTMDSLITGLKNVPHFIMIDRGRIERVLREQGFAQTGFVDTATAVRVGKLVQAGVLITGSIQVFGPKLRITANFTDVQTGEVRDSQQVTGTDIFELQDQLASLFIKRQNVTVTPIQQQRVEQVIKSTASLTAYDHYLKGRKAYLLSTRTGYEEAVRWYNKAIEVDPRYALAYAGLAEAWDLWGWAKEQNGEPYQAEYEQAYQAARRALELNPNLAEAHRAFGMASDVLGKPGREVEARKALELNPNDAETWYELWVATGNDKDPDHEYIRKALELNSDLAAARLSRGLALNALKRYDEAIAEFRAALRINPGHAMAHYDLGNALFELKRYDEAIAEFRAALRLNPDYADAHHNLGITLQNLERYEEAAQEYEIYLRLVPDAGDAAEIRALIRRLRGRG